MTRLGRIGIIALSRYQHSDMSEVTPTSQRKSDHIQINLQREVKSGLTTGLEKLHFEHNALPELDLAQIDLSLEFLGRKLKAPILISSMTGGTPQAERINQVLAEAAQAAGVAMGLGSQRAALEDPALETTFQVRRHAPDILLFANLGAVQLNKGYGIAHCQRAVEMVEADALVLHLNSLQEALQPEGDADFGGMLSKIEAICRAISVPVVIKEVGWGISADVALRLADVGVSVIDVAGAGGTSWSEVERHRASDERMARLAAAFVNWGIPTAVALSHVRQALPNISLIASGGLRSGTDVAKCVALGADLCGLAGPFLKAAVDSRERTVEEIELLQAELRICMFGTGSADLQALKRARMLPLP